LNYTKYHLKFKGLNQGEKKLVRLLNFFGGQQSASRGTVAISFMQNQLAVAITNHSESRSPFMTFCESISCTAHEQQSVLNELSKTHQLNEYTCHLVLSPEQYYLITLEKPDVSEDEIKEAVRWKINDRLEYPAEQAVIDYYTLPDSNRTNSNKMLDVIASPRKNILAMTEKCQQAGLNLTVIDIQETVLRNLATLLPESNQGVALLYLGKDSGTIVIQKLGCIYLSRKIAIGCQQLQQKEPFSSSAQLNLEHDNLALEIQRSLDYVESYFGIPPVSSLAIIPIPEDTQQLLNVLNNSHVITGRIMDLSAIIDSRILLDDKTQNLCAPVIGATLRHTLES